MDVEHLVEESEEENPDNNEEELTCFNRRPEHEQCLAEVFQLDCDELLSRLAIDRYDQSGFIPAEVLVTLARSGFGRGLRVQSAIAVALNRSLIKELRVFINSQPKWINVLSRSSESVVEAVADVRSSIFTSKQEVSFAEVSFRVFVDKRLRDWFKGQARFKNSMLSVDGLTAAGDDEGPSFVDQMEDDPQKRPDELFALKQIVDRCLVAVLRLPARQRMAITLHVLQDMTLKEAGEQMKLDESTVRYHVKAALVALQQGELHV